ncbi:hypothetical protein H6F67_20700 [Microcoleus sp. FACHB-1515]|uniref:hypothetical protein n=1 Tax=Cyanophyceae TaxID=3028117 RepID=UPI0016879DC0|nr:hypothetical protein [Microcoleus sp. FACHB-1515]MBD2092272.1 hypothetical protein [Microcoleus sp. FACHB-1515]
MTYRLLDVAQLAADRGCMLKMMRIDDAALYWVENCLFIGKPYAQLDDLIAVLLKLPLFDPEACASFCALP